MQHSDLRRGAGERNASLAWLLPVFCAVLTGTFTFAAPNEATIELYGTESLLPYAWIVRIKILIRLFTLGTLSLLVFQVLGRPRSWRVLHLATPWLAYAAWGVLSVAWSAMPKESLGQVVGFITILLIAVGVGLTCHGERATSRVLHILSWAMLFWAWALILLHYASPDLAVLTKRSGGLFHSTIACSSSSLALVVMVAARLMWGWGWTRRLLVPAVVTHVAVMVIGVNRTSMALTCALLLVVALLYLDRRVLVGGVLATGVIGALLLAADPRLNGLRAVAGDTVGFLKQGETNSALGTLSGRDEMWAAMFGSFMDSPLIGHGYFVTSRRGEIYVWHDWGNWTAHSLYLQVATTTGAIGIVLFFGAALLTLGRLHFWRGVDARMTGFCSLLCVWYGLWGLLNSSLQAAIAPESIVFGCVLGLAISALVAAESADSYAPGFDEKADRALGPIRSASWTARA